MKKNLLKTALIGAAILMSSSAMAAVGDVTTILNQTFTTGNELTNTDEYTWGEDIQGMEGSSGLQMTNTSSTANNFTDRNLVTFTNAVGNDSNEVNISYVVNHGQDKGQTNTNYIISFFGADDALLFSISESSGGWGFSANITYATADGTASSDITTHIGKYSTDKTVDINVTFSGTTAIISLDGASYSAYTAEAGIKSIKLSVSGGSDYDRYMNIKSLKVTTTEMEALVVADYTLKYVCDGEILKTETKAGTVGDAITLTSADTSDFTLNGVKYIYVSNDAEGQTIASDGSTVVTITYRKAAEYNYTVTNNVNDEVKTGVCVEGESVTVPYCYYILDADGTLWNKAQTNKEFNYTFTPNSDNYTTTLTYTKTTKTDVLYYSEGEDIEGMTYTNGSNANIRCSNAAGGYASDPVEFYTLQPGVYKIGIGMWGNSGAEFVVKAGETQVASASTNGSWGEVVSEEFTIKAETTLTVEGTSSSKPLDFIFIQKTGDYTPVEVSYQLKYMAKEYLGGGQFDEEESCFKLEFATGIEGEPVVITSEEKADIVDVTDDGKTRVYSYVSDDAEGKVVESGLVITLQYAYNAAAGVEDVTVDAIDNGKWYNLQGIEVAEPTQPGLYIHNGKKVIIK